MEGPGKATRGERAWVKDLWREKNLAVPARSWPELYHTQLPRVPFSMGAGIYDRGALGCDQGDERPCTQI